MRKDNNWYFLVFGRVLAIYVIETIELLGLTFKLCIQHKYWHLVEIKIQNRQDKNELAKQQTWIVIWSTNVQEE